MSDIDIDAPAPGITIRAEAHSDDYEHQALFDAVDWFAQSDSNEIISLAECGWGGDYPADAVADHFEDSVPALAAMFEHCIRSQGRRDSVGFECHVNPTDAAKWLLTNRPALYLQLTKRGLIEPIAVGA